MNAVPISKETDHAKFPILQNIYGYSKNRISYQYCSDYTQRHLTAILIKEVVIVRSSSSNSSSRGRGSSSSSGWWW